MKKKNIRCKYCKKVFRDIEIPKLCPKCNHNPKEKKLFIELKQKFRYKHTLSKIRKLKIKCEVCKKEYAVKISDSKYKCRSCT